MTDHYEVLGVSAQAPDDVIRAAFKARIRQTHPDSGGRPGEAQLVNEAYAVLSDPGRRALYDRERILAAPAPETPLTASSPAGAEHPQAPTEARAPIKAWWRRGPAGVAGATWLVAAAAVIIVLGISASLWTYAWVGAAVAAVIVWALAKGRWKITAASVLGLGAMALAIPGLLPLYVLLGTSITAGFMIRATIEAEVDERVLAQVDSFWQALASAENADAWFAEAVAPEGSRTRVLLQQLDGQERTTRSLWGVIDQGTYLLLTENDEPMMSVPHMVMERASKVLKRHERNRRG